MLTIVFLFQNVGLVFFPVNFWPGQGLLICSFCRVVSEYDSREAWPDVYEFVSDRLRAVRQDMVVENLDAEKSILLLESMIPFYAEAEYRWVVLIKINKLSFTSNVLCLHKHWSLAWVQRFAHDVLMADSQTDISFDCWFDPQVSLHSSRRRWSARSEGQAGKMYLKLSLRKENNEENVRGWGWDKLAFMRSECCCGCEQKKTIWGKQPRVKQEEHKWVSFLFSAQKIRSLPCFFIFVSDFRLIITQEVLIRWDMQTNWGNISIWDA